MSVELMASGSRPYRRSQVRYPVVFFGIFIALNLHVLRNLHPAYYLVIAIAQGALALFLFEGAWLRGKRASLYFALFLMASLLAGLHSMLRMGLLHGMEGFLRFNFTLLLAAGAYKYCRNWEIARKLLIMYLLIICFAFLSLPYQFLFGPVSWFVDFSTRGEFDRYASLLGNLSAVGEILGPVLILVLVPPVS